MIPYNTISVPSTFPIESRPIYLYPLTSVTHKTKAVAYPLLTNGILEICRRNPSNRILIHSVGYELTTFLSTNLASSDPTIGRRLVSYKSSIERQRAIDIYLSTRDSILIAPSLDRGIDLPGDDCRVIIVCKVPYPNLGDKQVGARLHQKGGQLWYNVQTVRSMVQMTGRGFRNKDDYCESFILDKQFMEIWKKNKGLFPKWWTDALVWDAGRLI